MDDDFEYEFEDSDDGEAELELELDDLKAALGRKDERALVRLTEIAREKSVHSALAALEILRKYPSSDHFRLFVDAIVHGSAETSEKSHLLAQGWHLVHSIPDYEHAVESLRSSPKFLYLRSVLLLANAYIQKGMSEKAAPLLQKDFSSGLLTSLALEARHLEFERIMLSTTASLTEIWSLLDELSDNSAAEMKARVFVQWEQLGTACTFLRTAVQNSKETHRDPTRSLIWLILVSILCDDGALDAPTPANSSEVVLDALNVSSAFRSRDAEKFKLGMSGVTEWIRGDRWKFASAKLLDLIHSRFIFLQISHVVSTYSRIRWSTLIARVPIEITTEDLTKFVWQSKKHRLNLVDETIDYAPRGDKVRQKIALPQMYRNRAMAEAQARVESDILNKWRARPKLTLEKKEENLVKSLERALTRHRDAVLN